MKKISNIFKKYTYETPFEKVNENTGKFPGASVRAGNTTIKYALYSNIGGRRINEDYARAEVVRGTFCAVLADGLGAHGGGEIASLTATNELFDKCPEPLCLNSDSLEDMMNDANEAVLSKQSEDCSMKTTAVTLLSDGKVAFWAHVGDSRLYYFHEGRIASVTKDHSVSQLAVESGTITHDGIRHHPDRNRLINALGGESTVFISTSPGAVRLADRDAFLLCSDGFWEYVGERDMERLLGSASSPESWLSEMCGLLDREVDGKNDNNSAIAVFVEINEQLRKVPKDE